MEYEPGQEVVPGYTLVGRLGSGMAGEVWIAQAAGGIHVAVKIIRNLSLIGGRKELGALKTIRNVKHPNLCPIFGFWTKDASGRILEDGETESITVDSMSSSVFSVVGRLHDTDDQSMQATMAVGPAAGAGDIRRTDGERAKAEQLIVVMGLGERTLSDRLAEVRREAGAGPKDSAGLQPAEIVRYLSAAANAIDLLNSKHKIFHCDIKPQNILIVGGDAQVCDFGIAHRFEGDVKKTSHAIATPAYGAPEVLQDQTYSTTVDQYSLAVTYYELRTGLLPFQATTAAGIAVAKATERLDLSKITAAERKVLQRALRVDPKARYGSCEELIHQLAIAAGVERKSGLSLGRLTLAAAAIALLIGGSLAAWRYTAPEHYHRTLAGFFGGPTATVLLDDAGRLIEQGQAEERFVRTSDHVRDALQRLGEARTVASADETSRADALGIAASQLLLQRWHQTLNEAGRAEPGAGYQSVLADLSQSLQAFQERLHAGDVLNPDDPRAEPLRASYELAALRLALEQNRGATDAGASADLERQMQRMRQRLDASDEFFAADDRVLAAVAVALPWQDRGDVDFSREPALADVERAEAAVLALRERSTDVLPAAYVDRWSQLRGRFVQSMNGAIRSGNLDPAVRVRLSHSFPELAIDAALADVKSSMLRGQWQQASSQLAEARRLAAADLTGEAQQQIDLLGGMLQAIEQPQQTLAVMRNLHQLGEGSREWRNLPEPELHKLIDAWLAALGQHWLDVAPDAGVLQLAVDARQAVLNLPQGITPPATLDAAVVAVAAALGPTSVASPDTVQSIDALLKHPTYAALAAAAEIEALAQQPAAAAERLQVAVTALQQSDPTALAITAVPPGYRDFALGLGQWAVQNHEQAKQTWAPLVADSDRLEQLGAPRRRQVADLRLRHLIDRSGVPDTDVVNLRYAKDPAAANAELVAIEHWLGSAAARHPVFVQQRMLAGAAADPQWLPSGELATAMNALRPEKLSGQSNRGLFELLRRIASPAGIERPTTVDLLVRATAAMLNANPELITTYNKTFFNDVLKPTFDILARTSRGKDGAYISTAADGVTRRVQEDLNAAAVRLACLAFANHTADSYSSTANDDYLTNLSNWFRDRSMAAATAASLESRDPAERQRLWLLAAESFQEFQTMQQGGWHDAEKVATLQRHVDQAAVPGVQPPRLLLLQAHLWQYRAWLAESLTERLKCYDAAIATLSQAIDGLQPGEGDRVAEGDRATRCDALIQRSAALVKRAFYGAQHERLPRLERAAEDAQAAAELAQQDATLRQLKADDAYLTLGNAQEDLAMYCYTDAADQARQRSAYEKAVEAFEQAIAVQGPLVRSSFNARVALGRCLYRYWRHHPNPELLDRAQAELSQIDNDALPHWQAEARVFLAQVYLAKEQLDEAVVQAQKAVDLLELESRGAVAADHYNTALLAFSDALAAKQRNAEALQVLDRLQNPTSAEFWKSAIQRSSLLSKSEQFERLLAFAETAIDYPLHQRQDLTIRQEDASGALAWIFTLLVVHTDGWSAEPKAPFTKQQVLQLIEKALQRLPAEGSEIATAHRDVIEVQRMVLTQELPVAAMQRLLSAIDTLQKRAPGQREVLTEYRRLVYDALALNQFELNERLPQPDKGRVLEQLQLLVDATGSDASDPNAALYMRDLRSLKGRWSAP